MEGGESETRLELQVWTWGSDQVTFVSHNEKFDYTSKITGTIDGF